MSKLNLRTAPLYAVNTDVAFVDVPPLEYLMIDGRGDPNATPAYQAAVEALFSLAYGLKMRIKHEQGIDYGVLPLEGLWWADDPEVFLRNDRAEWQWTMLIRQPEWVDAALVAEVQTTVAAKKRLPALEAVRFATLEEGYAAQITHIGPFSSEGPTVARLHAAIEAAGQAPSRKHHEIYLSDVRRAAPDKWRTIIRQPCQAIKSATAAKN